jgi:cell division protease FtsH
MVLTPTAPTPATSREASDMPTSKQPAAAAALRKASSNQMGPLELAAYQSDWKASQAYHRHVEHVASRRELEARAGAGQDEIINISGRKANRAAVAGVDQGRGFAALRAPISDIDDEDAPERDVEASTPGRVAARLLLARLFDRNPSVLREFHAASPVVIVDVPDRAMHGRIAHQWKAVLALTKLRLIDFSKLSDSTKRQDYDAVFAVSNNALSLTDRGAADQRAFAAIQLALPILAITPSAESHLSKVLLDAAAYRLMLPPIDAALISRVIRIVCGKPYRQGIPDQAAAQIGLHELLLAVRFDRTPAQCVERLLQLVAAKTAKRGSRELSLDELHGLDEAVAWAKSTIVDLEAWRRGEVGWDAIDAGVVLDGPAGTGKTTFAKVAADAMRLPLITATLAKWQASGEAHLGHLLRAMRKDFDEARSKPDGAVVFIDELDSFPNRATLTHSHKDYVIEVVNAFIEQLDGLQGRQKLIFIAATNDVRRCDPAIVRAGRLNRIINVRLPGPSDIEKMMRVRLRGDLMDEALEEMSLLAIGSTGADVERIIKDSRRHARQEERPLCVADIRRAILGRTEELSPQELERAAVHEAGHILLSVVHGGPDDIHAVVAGSRVSSGFVVSRNRQPSAGTLDEYRRMMQGLLAGRAAEEIEFGAAGSGSGSSEASDLSQATQIAAALIGSYGHAGPHPLLYLGERHRTDLILDHAYLRTAAHQELAGALDEARRVLLEHRDALKEVAERLRKRGRIDGHEVEQVLSDYSGNVQAEPDTAGGPNR